MVSCAIFDRISLPSQVEIAAVKFLYVAIGLLLLQCLPAVAEDQNCMNDYYRTRIPACVDAVLSQFGQPVPGTTSEPSAVVGFLAQIFITSSTEKQRILSSASTVFVKWVDLLALQRAGLTEDARKFADENRLAAVLQRLESNHRPPLAEVRPLSIPADNDLLIGAYMASGDTGFIERILGNFSSLDDSSASDALRMGLMTSKFGPTFTPKGRENVMSPASCAKYQCKADPAKFLRLLTASSAFWALQSLAQRDDGIRKTFSGFFARDARLKNLLAAEQAAFGNYIAALAMSAAFKPDQVSPEGRQTYEAMSKAASAYENLEPAQIVLSYIEPLAKSGKPQK